MKILLKRVNDILKNDIEWYLSIVRIDINKRLEFKEDQILNTKIQIKKLNEKYNINKRAY